MKHLAPSGHEDDLRYASVLGPLRISEWLLYLLIRFRSRKLAGIVASEARKFLTRLGSIGSSIILRLASAVNSTPADESRLVNVANKNAAGKENDESAKPDKSKVTITSSGHRIVDKRRPISTESHHGGNSDADATQESSTGAASQPAPDGLTAKVTRNIKSLGYRAIGWIVRHGTGQLDEVGLTDLTLGQLLWRSPSHRAVLGAKSAPIEAGDILALGENIDHGDWRMPVMHYLTRRVARRQLADLVSAELARHATQPLPERRFTLVMRVGAHIASSLPDDAAQALLRVALASSRRNIDPYGSNGSALVSRAVATRLLELRPELEGVILRSLELQRSGDPSATGVGLLVEARIGAMAARNRAPDFGASLIRIAVSGGFGPEQLEGFAKLADMPLVTEPRIRLATARWPRLAITGLFTRRIMPWVAPPVLALLASALAKSLEWSYTPAVISLGSGIAALGLLAAVHVFTVQLSASRLPGIISRSAGRPWQLICSYSSVLTMLTVSLVPKTDKKFTPALGWASATSLFVFVASLLVAMFLILRRTDAGRAAKGYVSATIPKARATGRRLGRLQAEAAELRGNLQTIPAIVQSPEPIVGEWSEPLTTDGRGFFQPSRRDMRRLLDRSAFRDGMKLRIVPGLGTIVAGREQVAALVPVRDQQMTRDLTRAAKKRLRVRSSVDTEEIASGVVALTSLALSLAKAGDTGTSHFVAEEAVRLIIEHTAATRASRTKAFVRQAARERIVSRRRTGLREIGPMTQAQSRLADTEVVPVVPALRDALNLSIQATLANRSGMSDVPEALISRLLASTGEAEAGVEIVTFAIPTTVVNSSGDVLGATELLRKAGVRALELRTWVAFSHVLDQLGRLDRDDDSATDAAEISSVLAATACRFDPRQAQVALDTALTQIAADQSKSPSVLARRRQRALLRVGAAALASGAVSVAVHAARKAAEQNDADSIAAIASLETLIRREAARASIRGGYLGDHGVDALFNFGTFIADLEPVLGSHT